MWFHTYNSFYNIYTNYLLFIRNISSIVVISIFSYFLLQEAWYHWLQDYFLAAYLHMGPLGYLWTHRTNGLCFVSMQIILYLVKKIFVWKYYFFLAVTFLFWMLSFYHFSFFSSCFSCSSSCDGNKIQEIWKINACRYYGHVKVRFT